MPKPKKPTALKVLEGNPGKRPLPKNEPKPNPTSPKRPTWLTGESKKMWEKLTPELERLGLLTAIDGEAFSVACQAYGTWVKCQRILKKEGLTYKYTNKDGHTNIISRPEIIIANKAISEFKAFCTEFGLTPASRTKIEVNAEQEKDPMEGLLSGIK